MHTVHVVSGSDYYLPPINYGNAAMQWILIVGWEWVSTHAEHGVFACIWLSLELNENFRTQKYDTKSRYMWVGLVEEVQQARYRDTSCHDIYMSCWRRYVVTDSINRGMHSVLLLCSMSIAAAIELIEGACPWVVSIHDLCLQPIMWLSLTGTCTLDHFCHVATNIQLFAEVHVYLL